MMRARGGGVETGDGEGSETGSVTEEEGNKQRGPISVPASPRTRRTKRRATYVVTKTAASSSTACAELTLLYLVYYYADFSSPYCWTCSLNKATFLN